MVQLGHAASAFWDLVARLVTCGLYSFTERRVTERQRQPASALG